MATPAGVRNDRYFSWMANERCFLLIQRRIIKNLKFKGCEETIGFFHFNGS